MDIWFLLYKSIKIYPVSAISKYIPTSAILINQTISIICNINQSKHIQYPLPSLCNINQSKRIQYLQYQSIKIYPVSPISKYISTSAISINQSLSIICYINQSKYIQSSGFKHFISSTLNSKRCLSYFISVFAAFGH